MWAGLAAATSRSSRAGSTVSPSPAGTRTRTTSSPAAEPGSSPAGGGVPVHAVAPLSETSGTTPV